MAEIRIALDNDEPLWARGFEFACAQDHVGGVGRARSRRIMPQSDHRLTKPRHPWSDGQVERMNRTLEDATVKRYHSERHDQLRSHLADFVAA